jgi:hypothetical protein
MNIAEQDLVFIVIASLYLDKYYFSNCMFDVPLKVQKHDHCINSFGPGGGSFLQVQDQVLHLNSSPCSRSSIATAGPDCLQPSGNRTSTLLALTEHIQSKNRYAESFCAVWIGLVMRVTLFLAGLGCENPGYKVSKTLRQTWIYETKSWNSLAIRSSITTGRSNLSDPFAQDAWSIEKDCQVTTPY